MLGGPIVFFLIGRDARDGVRRIDARTADDRGDAAGDLLGRELRCHVGFRLIIDDLEVNLPSVHAAVGVDFRFG